MKIKTSELIDAALDWAVAKCEGDDDYLVIWRKLQKADYFAPSADWAQGGPIIEREEIDLAVEGPREWRATLVEGCSVSEEVGPTPLIAAMRCYVASQLGNEIDVPEKLIKEK